MAQTYMLRGVDPLVWRKSKARAALEGLTLREVVTDLLTTYASGAPDNNNAPKKCNKKGSDNEK